MVWEGGVFARKHVGLRGRVVGDDLRHDRVSPQATPARSASEAQWLGQWRHSFPGHFGQGIEEASVMPDASQQSKEHLIQQPHHPSGEPLGLGWICRSVRPTLPRIGLRCVTVYRQLSFCRRNAHVRRRGLAKRGASECNGLLDVNCLPRAHSFEAGPELLPEFFNCMGFCFLDYLVFVDERGWCGLAHHSFSLD